MTLASSDARQRRFSHNEPDDGPEVAFDPMQTWRSCVESRPRVSVIMATLNCAQYLSQAIQSVVDQTMADWELIVMDGGSTDDTIAIAQGFRDERIRIYQEHDSGIAEAWDKAAKRAHGDYVMLLCGNDAYVTTNWLETCVAILDSDIEVSLVWGIPSLYDGDEYVGLQKWPWGAYVRSPKKIAQAQKQLWLHNWLATGAYFCDGNMCVRRNVFLACLPRYAPGMSVLRSMFSFYFTFNRQGFLPFGVPEVVSLSRLHDGQWTQKRQVDWALTVADYMRRVRRYRRYLLEDRESHVFRDGVGNNIGIVPPLAGRLEERDFFIVRRKNQEVIDGTRLYEKTGRRLMSRKATTIGPVDAEDVIDSS